ncbi:SRPBCC family protein [Actinophytocola oryzae]|uniref:Polyketide cyclase/dehydrase/lipid transport protein n=1 Tax=Actinophytocola oryzae TaxID=502181 RepID=A0A4R7VVN0_9PSEU|nr:SRPBCC family protein [Actinophytocola oryzae]TDV53685.1 polyketide cyclase/dehydrase/lipid transport protein [Actinophytocola oryzae]
MTTFERSVEVRVPLRAAYHQWTRFESYPRFLAGVDSIVRTAPTRIHWHTVIGEFDAEIIEQHPDERVAWRTVNGPRHVAAVTFHRIDDQTTRVCLRLKYAPGVSHLPDDLRPFKTFIEGLNQGLN